MSDLVVFTHPNHDMDKYHRILNTGIDGRLFIRDLGDLNFVDRNGIETSFRLYDNITSLEVGPNVFVRLYIQNEYSGDYESFLPGDAPRTIAFTRNHCSLKMWKVPDNDPRNALSLLSEISSL